VTQTERIAVRVALLNRKFDRRGSTSDTTGDGVYQEFWRHADGSTVTIAWAKRDPDPPQAPKES
jgi:hypothetical protein